MIHCKPPLSKSPTLILTQTDLDSTAYCAIKCQWTQHQTPMKPKLNIDFSMKWPFVNRVLSSKMPINQFQENLTENENQQCVCDNLKKSAVFFFEGKSGKLRKSTEKKISSVFFWGKIGKIGKITWKKNQQCVFFWGKIGKIGKIHWKKNQECVF